MENSHQAGVPPLFSIRQRRKREPIQLSLFDALTDLDQDLETMKKSVGRVELEIERAFGKRA
jgi:hypothetical protein